MARTFALAIPATWNLLVGQVLSACNAPVSQTGELPENAEKRYRQWCRGAAYGAVQFARICTGLHGIA
jgi:hypothetical protein